MKCTETCTLRREKSFSYTKNTEKASIGRIKIEVEEKERVNVPIWAGAAMAIAGGVLLARKR